MSDPGGLGIRDFERSLPMALLRAREAVMRRFRPLLAEHGVTEQQWRVLRALADSDSPKTIGALADRTLLLGPSLSRMLATLDERGLVLRTPAPGDARRTELTITAHGRRLVAAIAPDSERRYRSIEDRLEPGALDELYRLLDHVAAID